MAQLVATGTWASATSEAEFHQVGQALFYCHIHHMLAETE
jgi:hypothetical protein